MRFWGSCRQKVLSKELTFLLFLSIIFFISSSIFLNLPGFGDEEAFLIDPVVSILKGIPPTHLTINLFGHKFFIMVCPWVGPICALLFFPSLSLFGLSIYVIRLTRIFYGFFTIVLLYYFVKHFFNKRTAKISAFLMATLPYYIFMYRHGYLDDGILPFFLLASLFCFYLFYKKEKAKFLYLGAFFSGLGMISKLNFIWFLIALSISLIILKIKMNVKKHYVLIALFIFVTVCSPLVLSNLANYRNAEANTIRVIKDNFFKTSFGENNFAFYKNVITNLRRLMMIFSSDVYAYTRNSPAVRKYIFTNPLYFPLFVISILFYLIWFNFRKKAQSKKIKLLISMIVIMFLFKNFTISVFRVEHFTIFLPIAIIIIANFINEFMNKRYLWLGYSIIIIITFLNIKSLYLTYEILYKTDESCMYGWSHPSSSIYKLTNYLLDNDIYHPITVAALRCNIRILSEGRIVPIRDLSNWKSYIERDNQYYYIARLDPYYKKRFNDFCDLANRYDKFVAIDKTFSRKDGTIDMIVFKLKEKIPKSASDIFQE